MNQQETSSSLEFNDPELRRLHAKIDAMAGDFKDLEGKISNLDGGLKNWADHSKGLKLQRWIVVSLSTLFLICSCIWLYWLSINITLRPKTWLEFAAFSLPVAGWIAVSFFVFRLLRMVR